MPGQPGSECCCSLCCASPEGLRGLLHTEEYMEHGVTPFSSFLWEDRKGILEYEKNNSFFRVASAVALMVHDVS